MEEVWCGVGVMYESTYLVGSSASFDIPWINFHFLNQTIFYECFIIYVIDSLIDF